MLAPSITVGQLVGHFRILEKIGGGGQGEVFRAHDERFDKDVALKILPLKALSDDAARKRFRQEAQAVGKLSHPNIATAFYFGEENGIDFLVTEYISGAGLDEKLAKGPLPQETVVALGIELASGLEAAHREGIIHRDLKPGNLRITETGQLKILDFGLAELIEPGIDAASAETVTLTMTLTGTLPYMAPEQFDGISDPRTDLWAAGVVLYELATGQLPFPQTQLRQLKEAIRDEEPKRPTEINPAISRGLESVILRALEKDPKRRYQAAKELHDDLVRVAGGGKVKRHLWLRRHRLQLAVAALLVAVSAGLIYRFWPSSASTDHGKSYKVLAVLPLETAGQDAADSALGRGVAETVSARIAQGSNGRLFQLIPPNELSSKQVKTAEAARREFGVDMVLAVGLQRSGDKMRVTCSLIDPRNHQQVDARTVTGDVGDLFTLEDTAVTEVFDMLPRNARSEQPAVTEVHAAVPAGYEYYVRGRGYLLEYQKSENIDSAISEFQHSLQVSPNYAPAYAGLGEAYWRGYKADRGKEWLDQAKTNCQKALAADPRLAEGHTCLGNLYNDTGQYDKAVKEFQRADSLDPDSVDALNGLAEAYDRLGNAAAAEDTYRKAITLRPQYWAVYNWLGYFYFGQARYADAAAMFRKVVDLTPDNNRGYSNLGAMYLMEGQYADAIAALNRSIELRPTGSALSNLGMAYFYSHRFSEAATMGEKALALDDKDYLNWGNLGYALYWTPGRREESFPAYKKGIELARADLQVNPKDTAALSFVAMNSAVLGDRRTALASLQKALLLAPKDAEVMFRAAMVYNQFGDQAQTLDWLKKAVAAHYSRTIVRDTPEFGNLQSNPNFKAIIGGA